MSVERNIGRCERAIRIAIGVMLIFGGLAVFTGVIGVVLAVVGAVLVFSGSVGFCHVRKFIGRFGSGG